MRYETIGHVCCYTLWIIAKSLFIRYAVEVALCISCQQKLQECETEATYLDPSSIWRHNYNLVGFHLGSKFVLQPSNDGRLSIETTGFVRSDACLRDQKALLVHWNGEEALDLEL